MNGLLLILVIKDIPEEVLTKPYLGIDLIVAQIYVNDIIFGGFSEELVKKLYQYHAIRIRDEYGW